MREIKLEIENVFFEYAENAMRGGIDLIYELEREKENIIIYMPYYFNEMYCRYLMERRIQTGRFITEFQGIKVIDGYENKIVISFKNAIFYNAEPVIINIP